MSSIRPAPPGYDEELAEASRHHAEGRLGEAARGYARCELLLSHEKSPRRADVLTQLARIVRSSVGPRDATSLLDLAVVVCPSHRAAVHDRLAIARELGEHAVAASVGQLALPLAESEPERVALLSTIADDALKAAAAALADALQLRPGDRGLLERLRVLHETTGDHAHAVNDAVALAETIGDPATRARALADAARLCADKTGNVGRAVALYEAAIADDPTVAGAFEAVESVLLASGDAAGVEGAYDRQIERLRAHHEVEAEARLLEKLAVHREAQLQDWQGAAAALDRLITLRPEDVDARLRLSAVLEKHGEDALAVRCLEVAAALAPKHAPTFRALHRVSIKRNDLDRAFNAAAVLVHHEEAEPEEQALYRLHAPRIAMQPAQALPDAAFALLAPADHDPIVTAIVASISDAAVALRLEQLRAAKLVSKVDPRDQQDLERSTVSAVRTVGWAARFFAMKPPAVYTRPGEPSGLSHLPESEPAVALGDALLTGRSVPELAFLIGYELATLRLIGRVGAFHASLAELRTLVVAAIGLFVPSELPDDVAAVRDALGPRLDAVRRLRLREAVSALGERGGQLDILRFLRSLERIACRAGLLACGDVNIAAHQIAMDGRTIGGLTAAERVRDLVGFSVSEPYAQLRGGLGLAVGAPRRASVPPPA